MTASKALDLSKGTLPLPFVVTMVALAISAAVGIWRIESQVSIITTTIEYERKLNDERFRSLEAKIETAGLRNAALAMSQELAKAQEQLKRQGR